MRPFLEMRGGVVETAASPREVSGNYLALRGMFLAQESLAGEAV
jgi:hypothetical protein